MHCNITENHPIFYGHVDNKCYYEAKLKGRESLAVSFQLCLQCTFKNISVSKLNGIYVPFLSSIYSDAVSTITDKYSTIVTMLIGCYLMMLWVIVTHN